MSEFHYEPCLQERFSWKDVFGDGSWILHEWGENTKYNVCPHYDGSFSMIAYEGDFERILFDDGTTEEQAKAKCIERYKLVKSYAPKDPRFYRPTRLVWKHLGETGGWVL